MRDVKYMVVIPALNPDEKLIELLKKIKAQTYYSILIVNDGSDKDKEDIFLRASEYGDVISHTENRGKGAAVKTALKEIRKNYTEIDGIVLADADGQHRIEDIVKVVMALKNERQLVLGSRQFTGKVPFKSKFGNSITRFVFRMAAGKEIFDTQTGLRAFSREMIPYLIEIPGERYEYEMNVLLKCTADKIAISEIPIETIYLEENKSSHFHAVKDSFRIYRDILKFAGSSFVSFLVDYLAYGFLVIITGSLATGTSLLISNIFARFLSASVNYHINKKLVFGKKENGIKTALQYFALAVFVLVMNTVLLNFMVTYVIANKFIAKIFVEISLFIISLCIQKFLIFKKDGFQQKEPSLAEYKR